MAGELALLQDVIREEGGKEGEKDCESVIYIPLGASYFTQRPGHIPRPGPGPEVSPLPQPVQYCRSLPLGFAKTSPSVVNTCGASNSPLVRPLNK